jgi:hypothetical protein
MCAAQFEQPESGFFKTKDGDLMEFICYSFIMVSGGLAKLLDFWSGMAYVPMGDIFPGGLRWDGLLHGPHTEELVCASIRFWLGLGTRIFTLYTYAGFDAFIHNLKEKWEIKDLLDHRMPIGEDIDAPGVSMSVKVAGVFVDVLIVSVDHTQQCGQRGWYGSQARRRTARLFASLPAISDVSLSTTQVQALEAALLPPPREQGKEKLAWEAVYANTLASNGGDNQAAKAAADTAQPVYGANREKAIKRGKPPFHFVPYQPYQRCKSCESLGLARGDRKWPLNDGHTPHFRGVRVALGTGYNRDEGNRRASRNGRVSISTRNPYWHDSQHFDRCMRGLGGALQV